MDSISQLLGSRKYRYIILFASILVATLLSFSIELERRIIIGSLYFPRFLTTIVAAIAFSLLFQICLVILKKWMPQKPIVKPILLYSIVAIPSILITPYLFPTHGFTIKTILSCASVWIIPSTVSIYMIYLAEKAIESHNNSEEEKLAIAKHERELRHEEVSQLIFISERGKNELTISTEQFLYAQSSTNYVTIHYLQNYIVEKIQIRNTIKSIESNIKSKHVIRPHRAYLVNRQKIDGIRKDGRHYWVVLNGCQDEIPIAERQISRFEKYRK